jgi:hypothetical protein
MRLGSRREKLFGPGRAVPLEQIPPTIGRVASPPQPAGARVAPASFALNSASNSASVARWWWRRRFGGNSPAP